MVRGDCIIIGVDAGETTAVAIVSLEGAVLGVESHKHWRMGDVIEAISKHSPAVIACDTNPTSAFARQLKRAFGARLVFPKSSFRVLDKERVAAKTGLKLNNKHERDALAAALKGYHMLSNKLRQAGKKAERKSKEKGFVERVQRRVLSGEKMANALQRS